MFFEPFGKLFGVWIFVDVEVFLGLGVPCGVLVAFLQVVDGGSKRVLKKDGFLVLGVAGVSMRRLDRCSGWNCLWMCPEAYFIHIDGG